MDSDRIAALGRKTYAWVNCTSNEFDYCFQHRILSTDSLVFRSSLYPATYASQLISHLVKHIEFATPCSMGSLLFVIVSIIAKAICGASYEYAQVGWVRILTGDK